MEIESFGRLFPTEEDRKKKVMMVREELLSKIDCRDCMWGTAEAGWVFWLAGLVICLPCFIGVCYLEPSADEWCVVNRLRELRDGENPEATIEEFLKFSRERLLSLNSAYDLYKEITSSREKPMIYLVSKSVVSSWTKLKKHEAAMADKEIIRMISPMNFTFVSHKWFGMEPDRNEVFLNYLKNLDSEMLWVDYVSVPQDDHISKMKILNGIFDVLIAASKVEVCLQNTDYQKSVWCMVENVGKKDLQIIEDELSISNNEDVEPLLSGLFSFLISRNLNVWEDETFMKLYRFASKM